VSETGSLFHGVRRFVWLFPYQQQPDPDSLTIAPNTGFAITLIHGSGVFALGAR
jgi:hypothetical protein